MEKKDLLALDLEELMKLVKSWGWSAYRGEQIFTWMQKKLVFKIADFHNLSLAQRQKLDEETKLFLPQIIKENKSADGYTIKLLLQLADGETIEMVLLFYSREDSRNRNTCCISTQTGCAMDCHFCATGQGGAGRNLTVSELISQVLLASQIAQNNGFGSISNVVYMGMGEPLANLSAVKKSLLLLNNSQGQNIGMRRMTISTCGLVPQIYELADWGQQVNLAVSLHAADDQLRARLMPIANKYSLDELITACRYYKKRTGRRITYEYALFKDCNDSEEEARKVVRLLLREEALINIIPANPVPKTGFFPSEVETVRNFCRILEAYGLNVSQREARGLDISAACGQLVKKNSVEV
ncbi:MAG: 23S rRNA (adenine(2503)-C(2))-methyltransferase RlmN [Bacillota bacterium]|jgi:23S rRNA (adenine2503-C2)-methyltransferase